MLTKKHDTKETYPLFWAFVVFFAIILPYVAKKIAKSDKYEFFIILGIGVSAGIFVFLKSKIDLIQYKRIYNYLTKENIENLLTSSVKICTEKHKEKNEEFFAEFLEPDRKRKKLISSIRSKNFEFKIKMLKDDGKHFTFNLDFNKGFAGLINLRTEERLKKIESAEEWKSFLMSKNSKFPTLIKCNKEMLSNLGYSEDEQSYIYDLLGIRSIYLCPVVFFKKNWYMKKERSLILGIFLYTSNLDIPYRIKDFNEETHSSLSTYRNKILKQGFLISEFPRIFEGTKGKFGGEKYD